MINYLMSRYKRRKVVNRSGIFQSKPLPKGATSQTIHDAAGNLTSKENATHKYCRTCAKLLPFEKFGLHRTKAKSGYQWECKTCKNIYNNHPNAGNVKRTTEQFRESSMYARMRGLIVKTENLNHKEIFDRFRNRCFKCGQDIDIEDSSQYDIDHTLPVSLWWPLRNKDATLLCSSRHEGFKGCNNSKHAKWPNEFYNDNQLRELSNLTGIDYDILNGPPIMCPETLKTFTDDMKGWIKRWREEWDDADDWMEQEFSKLKKYAGIEVPDDLWRE